MKSLISAILLLYLISINELSQSIGPIHMDLNEIQDEIDL